MREDIPQRTDIVTPFNYRKRRHGLVGQHDGRCGGCRHEFPFRNFTVDHVISRSRGGTDHLGNLQLLRDACNSVKGGPDAGIPVGATERAGGVSVSITCARED